MKRIIMLIFSILVIVFGLSALFWGTNYVLHTHEKPLFLSSFLQSDFVTMLWNWIDVETIANFFILLLLMSQISCFVCFIISGFIGGSIIEPQRKYSSVDGFRKFVRRNLGLYRLGHLLLIISFASYILVGIANGLWGIFWGLLFSAPGIIVTFITLGKTLRILFLGTPKDINHCYCGYCNSGSNSQFDITFEECLGSEHSGELSGTITTTTYSDGRKTRTVDSKDTRRTDYIYRNTYSCVNCGNSFTENETSTRYPGHEASDFASIGKLGKENCIEWWGQEKFDKIISWDAERRAKAKAISDERRKKWEEKRVAKNKV